MALVAAIVPACGTGDPAATCGKVQPCGGRIVGDWNLIASCETTAVIDAELANDPMTAKCPAITVRDAYATVSGNVTFNADSTYSTSQEVRVTIDFNLPESCAATLTCEEEDANLQAAIDSGAIVAGWCTGTPCVCHEVVPANKSATGTYATTGTTFTTTPTAGTASSADYCIQQGTAHFMDVSMSVNLGGMGRVVIDADLVGEKQ